MADFGYGGSPGTYLYGDDAAYRDFANLSRAQSSQSLSAGERAAQLSDPYAEQRKRDIENLRLLESNPGSITTSPFYQFLKEQALSAVDSKNRALGLDKSGRGAMALADRAQQVATQAYFPLLNNLTQRAISGSSPTAAGVTYERSIGRSQDQSQMAAAARAAGQTRPPQVSAPAPLAPTPPPAPQQYSGGYGLPYSYGLGSDVMPDTPGYQPSANAGTGYVLSDYGASDVNGPGSQYYSYGSPATDYGAFDPYSSSDFGYGGDYG